MSATESTRRALAGLLTRPEAIVAGTRVSFPVCESEPDGPFLVGEVVQDWAGCAVIRFPLKRERTGLVVLGYSRFSVVGPPLQARLDFEEAA